MKKTISIIVITLVSLFLLFLVYLSSTKKEKYFNPIVLDNTNTIINATSEKYLDTIVYAGMKSLNFKDVNLVILPMSKGQVTPDLDLDAYVVEFSGSYYLYIRQLSKHESMIVVAHELIHVYQYKNHNLTIKPNMVVIWNDVYYDGNIVKYEDRPWEIDAFNKQNELKNKIYNILYE